MLRWTSAGAVSAPTTLQIRAQQLFPGRIAAGAPSPTRGLDSDELRANLRHFTVGLRTPRTRPCTGLVLSGQGVASRPDLPDLLGLARREGMTHIVLHAEGADAAPRAVALWRDAATTVVIPLRPGPDLDQAAAAVQRARATGLRVATNTVLDRTSLPRLDVVVDLLIALGQGKHTFTYPFPTGPRARADAPAPLAAVHALSIALDRLDRHQLPADIKGLPACYLGRHGDRLRRTQNRWYVDAEHQGSDALLFFPDVVRFHKSERCRFCAVADRCDGFFATYLARTDAPALHPIDLRPDGAGTEGEGDDDDDES